MWDSDGLKQVLGSTTETISCLETVEIGSHLTRQSQFGIVPTNNWVYPSYRRLQPFPAWRR